MCVPSDDVQSEEEMGVAEEDEGVLLTQGGGKMSKEQKLDHAKNQV